MRLRAVAAAAVVVVLAMPAIHAQYEANAPAPQGGRGARAPRAPQTPLSTTLYNTADALGMLRGAQEVDRVATVRYWAAGTMTVNRQSYTVTAYVGNVNYLVPGMRADITRTAPDGKSERRVEVVSDKFAWNETQPGMNATPSPADVNARLLQIWMLPQGIVKAATAAGAAAKVTTASGTTTLSFPIASINATITATIDNKNFFRDVEARMGTTVINTTYSDYGDWNGDDYLSDVMFPKHIVQKVGGVTTLDLTESKTNTYNPYVVMPVPDNIQKAAATSQSASAR
jgi:hypothetical protein